MLKLFAERSRRWSRGSMTVLALSGLALTATNAEAQDDGEKVYNTVCATCHQASGQGVPGVFPPVANSQWVTGDEAVLVRIILHGVTGELEVGGEFYSGMMPPWGGALDDEEVAAVATYLRSHFGNEAEPVTEELVARVREEYAARKTPWTVEELLLDPETQK